MMVMLVMVMLVMLVMMMTKIRKGVVHGVSCALPWLVALFLAAGGAASGEELLHIGYESGNISPQPGVDAQKPRAADSITVDCTVARAGRCALRTELQRTDAYVSFGNYRAETETADLMPIRYSPGESWRYGFSFKVAGNWQFDNPRSIDSIWQFKRFGSHADMFVSLKGHDVVLRVLSSAQYILKKDFQPGKWMDIMMDVLWSNGNDGKVVVHLREEGEKDYHQVASFTGANLFDATPRGGRPKWGLYKPAFPASDFAGSRVVYHDEIFVDKLH